MSKRLQVTVKDEVYELVEKLSAELIVSKSAIISLAVQEYEKNQMKKNA